MSPVGIIFIGVLFWMLVAHFLCDYALQSDAMAVGKNFNLGHPGAPWPYWMTAHCMIHAGAVTLITGSLFLGLAEFGLHFIADTLKCAKISNIHTDQGFHIACKLLWALIAATSGAITVNG